MIFFRSVKLAGEPFRPEQQLMLAGPAGTASRTGRSESFQIGFQQNMRGGTSMKMMKLKKRNLGYCYFYNYL